MARTKNRFNAIRSLEPKAELISEKKIQTFRVALYARLSVELKAKPSESIANQLSIMREFVKERPEFVESLEYVDNAVSGTDFGRPAFKQMMEDIRAGKISCVIVKDLSRFGRDYIEASNYIETIFPFLGVRFISINDNFDTSEEFNRNKALEIALKNLVNDMYAKDISKRVSVSRRIDMERGKFTGSNAPYGYKINGDNDLRKYVIDNDAAAVVRQIFELAAKGVSLREIARSLQDYKIALPGDYLKTGKLYVENDVEIKAWYPGTISNMLKNQAYIGNMVQGKRSISLYDHEKRHWNSEDEWIVVENTHDPIIDKELFFKVRTIMEKKVDTSIFNSERGKEIPIKEDILYGIIFCGKCGRRVPQSSRILEKEGMLERQYFYSCRYNYDFGGEPCGCTILERDLLEAVYKLLEVQVVALVDCRKMETLLKKTLDKEMKEYDIQVHKMENKIERKKYEESRSYQDYVSGEITKSELKCLQEKNVAEIKIIQEQISNAISNKQQTRNLFDKKMKWLEAAYRFKGDRNLDKKMIEVLVDSIYIYPDKNIQIKLNFMDEYKEIIDGEVS